MATKKHPKRTGSRQDKSPEDVLPERPASARPARSPKSKRAGSTEPVDAADEDSRFLSTYDVSAFERPSLTVDVALLTVHEGSLRTLLLRRDEPPHRGRWALPGGFVAIDESLDVAAARVLSAKTGLRRVFVEQLYTFGDVLRDPRTRVVSVTYYALLDRERLVEAKEGCAVATLVVPWEGETGGPVGATGDEGDALTLAFDHADILGMAVKRVRGKLDYTPIGFQLLPERFTLLDLQQVHETVLDRPVNKDSFRRRMLATGLLEATGEHESGAPHRPAELYRFVKRSAV